MNPSIEQSVLALMTEHLSVRPEQLEPDAQLVDQLYLDSLDLMDLLLTLNDAFDIELGVEDLVSINTVADVCRVVERHLAGSALREGEQP
ncbi:acyl carrier protein [Chromobacterium amazonense]|uniref:Acyl carrier protein n=1 Tax=Chromobacterium amazonense TaxID=1382803 RepID=A0ABU8V1P1_9NEIS|nr:acyl carrier protein [Chromobacterium amazonense]MDE1716048.1 acyl carrier protein [Chromobacterium amazonense]MDQ4541463.1 acyl carrier protein [Chromobacterium amazonense]